MSSTPAPPAPPDDITLEIPLAKDAPVTAPDRCTLTVLAGPAASTVVTFDRQTLVVGRGETADLRIDDPGISREHVRFTRVGSAVQLTELKSRNGTTVDGKVLDGTLTLRDRVRVQLGRDTVIRVEIHDALEQEAAQRLYESGVRDPLTRLFNRRYLDDRLLGEAAYAKRHRSPLSLILVDLDHFKSINDDTRFGHLAGDAVLRVVAATLQRLVRVEDVVARFGGEELVVLARSTTKRNAEILAERIRKAVEALSIPWETHVIRLTASLGIATLDETQATRNVLDLLARADEALYRAKREGRNRVVAY